MFNTQSENAKIKMLNKHEKLLTATIMQLKFGHDYFKSYLKNLINDIASNKCYERCHDIQNSEHLIINCHHFRDQQLVLIKKMKSQSRSII